MPEGPSLVMLKEEIMQFKGKTVLDSSGNAKIDTERANNKKLLDIRTWGKHLLLCFSGFTMRVHLMLFGSYKINEGKNAKPKLTLTFVKGELNFYACSVKLIEEDLDEVYDWAADIMSNKWSSVKAKKKLLADQDMLVCDALLDQDIFAGSGNIIKNEVLFRTRIHPQSTIGALPAKQLKALISETPKYAFDFLEWKKKGVLKKNWQAYAKKTCPRDHTPLQKQALGKGKRRTFFCEHCQQLYV